MKKIHFQAVLLLLRVVGADLDVLWHWVWHEQGTGGNHRCP